MAISLERHILRPGETIRAFVVEQRGARQGFSGKLEADLPVLENVKLADLFGKREALEIGVSRCQ